MDDKYEIINDFKTSEFYYHSTDIKLEEYIGDGEVVNIPENTKEIKYDIFKGKHIKRMVLPEEIKKAGEFIKELIISRNFDTIIESTRRDLDIEINDNFDDYYRYIPRRKGCRYIGNVLLRYEGESTTFKVPETFTRIANRAFNYSDRIRTLIIPETVIAVGKHQNYGNSLANIYLEGDTYIANEAFDIKRWKSFKINFDIRKTNNIDLHMAKYCMERRGASNEELVYLTCFEPYSRNTKMFKDIFEACLTKDNINEFLYVLMEEMKKGISIKTPYATMILYKLEQYKNSITLSKEKLTTLYSLLIKSNKSFKNKILTNDKLSVLFNVNKKINQNMTVHKGPYLIRDEKVIGLSTSRKTMLVPSNCKIDKDAFLNTKVVNIYFDKGSTNIDKEWLSNASLNKKIYEFTIPSAWITKNIKKYRDVTLSEDLKDRLYVTSITDENILTVLDFLVNIGGLGYHRAFDMVNLRFRNDREKVIEIIDEHFASLNKGNNLTNKEASIDNLLSLKINDKLKDFLGEAIDCLFHHLNFTLEHNYGKEETVKLVNGEVVDIKYFHYILMASYVKSLWNHSSNEIDSDGFLALFDQNDIAKFVKFKCANIEYLHDYEVDDVESEIIYRFSNLKTTYQILATYFDRLKWFSNNEYHKIEKYLNSAIASLCKSNNVYILSSVFSAYRLSSNKISSFLENIKDIKEDIFDGEVNYKNYKIKLQKDFTLKAFYYEDKEQKIDREFTLKILDDNNNYVKEQKDFTINLFNVNLIKTRVQDDDYLNKLFLLVNNRKKCLYYMVNDNLKIKFKNFKSLYLDKQCYLNNIKNIVFGIYKKDTLVKTFKINDFNNYTDIYNKMISINDNDYIGFVDASELIDFDNKDYTNLNKWIAIFKQENLEEAFYQFQYIELADFEKQTIKEYGNKYRNRIISYEDMVNNFYVAGCYDCYPFVVLLFSFGDVLLNSCYFGDRRFAYFDFLVIDNTKRKKGYIKCTRRNINRDLLLIEAFFNEEKNKSQLDYLSSYYHREIVIS